LAHWGKQAFSNYMRAMSIAAVAPAAPVVSAASAVAAAATASVGAGQHSVAPPTSEARHS